MKIITMACAALTLISAPAFAGDLKGFGTAACGELVDSWNSADENTKGVVVVAVGQWAFGYFSGRNAHLPRGQRKELQELDNDKTALFILEQCASHRNLRVYQIAEVIYNAAPRVSTGV